MPQSSVLCGAEPGEPAAARLYLEQQNASELRILWSRTRGTQGHQALSKKNKTPQSLVLYGAGPEELMTTGLYPKKLNAPMLCILWGWASGTCGCQSLSRKVKCPNAMYSVGLG